MWWELIMEEKLFKSILREAYEREYNELTAGGEHKFSLRHRMRMRKVLRKYDSSGVDVNKAMPKTTVRRRLTVALIVVLVAAILTVTVVALVMNGFKTVEKEDHTEVFAIDIENAPTTIEEVYELTNIPEDFVLYDLVEGSNLYVHKYKNHNDDYLFLYQYTKYTYAENLNTEPYPYDNIMIGDYNGILVILGDEYRLSWCVDDYVLRLFGTLHKDDMIDLAISTTIKSEHVS